MSFPAMMDFEVDPDVTHSRWRVYCYCRRNSLDFARPKPLKVYVLAECMGMDRRSVQLALGWLVRAGYLLQHGRHGRVRLLTLAYDRRGEA